MLPPTPHKATARIGSPARALARPLAKPSAVLNPSQATASLVATDLSCPASHNCPLAFLLQLLDWNHQHVAQCKASGHSASSCWRARAPCAPTSRRRSRTNMCCRQNNNRPITPTSAFRPPPRVWCCPAPTQQVSHWFQHPMTSLPTSWDQQSLVSFVLQHHDVVATPAD